MKYPDEARFSRVLADVPCLSDKTACSVPDNNIFKTTRTKERLNLVKVQARILLSALKAMSQDEGSTTVYSTCTLSPVENDGVVMQALKETEVPNLAVDLHGLLEVLMPFERYNLFRLNRTRFGVLIEPSIFSNFGPMYVSRIVVNKGVVDESVDSSSSNEAVSSK
jgi:16S rRNA C967 or C1407 C5-methylase (RsmB/RsmF family)